MSVLPAPPDANVRHMSGVWSLNRTVSDPTDEILRLQCVSWLLRKVMGFASLTATITQYKDDNGVPVFTLLTEATGGLRNEEYWEIDGIEKDKETKAFGSLKAKVSFVTLDDLEDDYQKEGWDEDCKEFLQTIMRSEKNGWVANSVSGFATVDGIRRNVRRVVVTKGDETRKARVIYDFVRPLDKPADT